MAEKRVKICNDLISYFTYRGDDHKEDNDNKDHKG
jgi:hypothetical protein